MSAGGSAPALVAALYVERGGVYFGLNGVDPWDEARDARKYAGPHPVVAHPPCARWGRYAKGGPNPRARRFIVGDDGGCFREALRAVRAFGGILEHPADSHAWRAFSLTAPPRRGGWIMADTVGGWTCCVEQRHYGHAARKATWLYAVGVELPALRWSGYVEGARPASPGRRLDAGFHSREERAAHRRMTRPPPGLSKEERARRRAYLESIGTWACPERMSKSERARTPLAFRDVLLSIARSVRAVRAA